MYVDGIRGFISRAQSAATLCLAASLPFYFNNFQRWAIILYVALSVLDIVANSRWRDISVKSAATITFILLICQYLLLLAYYPLEESTQYFGSLLEFRLSFVVLSIIGIFLSSKRLNVKMLGYVTSAVSVGIIIYTLSFIEFSTVQNFFYFRTAFNTIRIEHVQAHMIVNLYMCGTMAIMGYLMASSAKWSLKLLYCAIFTLLYLTVISSDGRIGFINANIVLFATFIYNLRSYKKLLIGASILLSVVVLAGLIAHPKFAAMKHISEGNYPVRFYIWQEALNLIKERPVMGYGANTAIEVMKEALLSGRVEDQFLIGMINEGHLTTASHSHNQFLQSLLEFGILGLLLMVATLVMPFLIIKNKRGGFFMAIFHLCVVIQLLTDILHSSVGEVGFVFYIILLAQLSSGQLKDSAPDNAEIDN